MTTLQALPVSFNKVCMLAQFTQGQGVVDRMFYAFDLVILMTFHRNEPLLICIVCLSNTTCYFQQKAGVSGVACQR